MKHKDLMVSLGGGVSSMHVKSSLFGDRSIGNAGGHVNMSFNYSAHDRWAFGTHYQRIVLFEPMESVGLYRGRSILISAYYRPLVSKRSFVDVEFGIGFHEIAFKYSGERVFHRAPGGAVVIGAAYHHMIRDHIGVCASVDLISSGQNPVNGSDGTALTNDAGEVVVLASFTNSLCFSLFTLF